MNEICKTEELSGPLGKVNILPGEIVIQWDEMIPIKYLWDQLKYYHLYMHLQNI